MTGKNRLIFGAVISLALFGVIYAKYRPNNDSTSGDKVSNLALVGETMVDVTIPILSKLEQSGQVQFLKYCSACHGIGGAGQKDVAPPLIHKIYEPSHHGDIAFQFAAERGVRAHHWPFGNMPPVENIKLAEIKSITLYIRTVQRANGIN